MTANGDIGGWEGALALAEGWYMDHGRSNRPPTADPLTMNGARDRCADSAAAGKAPPS